MTPQRRPMRIILIALLSLAIIVLAIAVAVMIPILTHQSAGGSGQQVPDATVSEVEATGADGRTRTLTALDESGNPADLSALQPGDRITLEGTGFDSGIGIYLAFCGIPDSPDEKPGPCIGGIPEGATEGEVDTDSLTSAWITNDWAWKAFATHRFGEDGTFEVTLTVPPAAGESIDCSVERCAISTRADHTAGSDRIQDMLLPIEYAAG